MWRSVKVDGNLCFTLNRARGVTHFYALILRMDAAALKRAPLLNDRYSTRKIHPPTRERFQSHLDHTATAVAPFGIDHLFLPFGTETYNGIAVGFGAFRRRAKA